MQSYQLTGPGIIERRNIPRPVLKKRNEVLVRINSVGICGSDIHYFKDGRIGSQVIAYPFTLGHEAAGTIVETGSSVVRVQPGDVVAIDPAMPCFDCNQCKAGRFHTCLNLKFLGNPDQADGCLSEYLVMPETSMYKLPKPLDFVAGAASEPLSIAYYAVQQARQEKHIGILGFGPIGMSVMRCAQHFGAEQIYVTDKIDDRLELARKAGCTWSGNPLKMDIVGEVMSLQPQQLDVVYECCGQQDAANQALELLKPGGILMIIGIPEFSRWSFNVDTLRHKEITIVNVRRQNQCIQNVLDLMAEGSLKYREMVTHRFHVSEIQYAFGMVAGYRDGVMKAMIDF